MQTPLSIRGEARLVIQLVLFALTFSSASAAVRILPLGDSITHGDYAHSTYRRPLWHGLTEAGYSVDFVGSQSRNTDGPTPSPDFDLNHEGHWGWTSYQIRLLLGAWLAGYTPDIVLLHIGTNDAFQNWACTPGAFPACTVAEIKSIIGLLQADNPRVTILLAKLIPVRDAAANSRINQLNSRMDSIAKGTTTLQSRVIVVDQNAGFSADSDTYDGTHPNPTGEVKIARRWIEALRGILPGVPLQHLLFYNNSAWDGRDPGANEKDDNAIAPDKFPLVPSQTASFSNYSSYDRGINGIMIDLVLPGIPTEKDMILNMGRSDDHSQWQTAPAPSSITIRQHAGASGADRLTLIWPDGALQNSWLEVTLLTTTRTGLVAPDTFCFGNAVGETGNSVVDAKVTGTDPLVVLHNLTTFALVGNPYDVNRDQRVDSADALISLEHLSVSNALPLITASPWTDPGSVSNPLPIPPQHMLQPLLWMERSASGGLELRILDPSPGPLRILESNKLEGGKWEEIPAGRIRVHPAAGLVFTISRDEVQNDYFFRAERRQKNGYDLSHPVKARATAEILPTRCISELLEKVLDYQPGIW